MLLAGSMIKICCRFKREMHGKPL